MYTYMKVFHDDNNLSVVVNVIDSEGDVIESKVVRRSASFL